MIKVLIVDDFESKVQDIRRVLVERCQITESQINVAASVSSGIRELTVNQYQLLILDLVLPHFDGEIPEERGGLSLLKDLNGRHGVNLPVHVICLTEYADVIKENQQEFDQLMVSSVVKQGGDSNWINQLAEVVNQTVRLNNHLLDFFTDKDKYDVGVICALQEEFDQLLMAFGNEKWRSYHYKDLPYQFKTCTMSTESMSSLRVIACCAGGAGMVPTAVLSSIMYSVFHVNQLYMTGFTGAISSSGLCLGDVLVSQSVQSFPAGKIIDSADGDIKLLKEIHQMPVNPQLLNMMTEFVSDQDVIAQLNSKIKKMNLQVKERETYQVTIAPTICVPFVLGSIEIQEELKTDNRKLKGIDMEGFALYYCAHQLSKEALWIKGVSDMADNNKDDKYHKTCAFSSAFLLFQFLKAKY